MPPPQDIVDLIARFARNIDAYKTGRYNETQLRREFIDPFFTALGWDVDNTVGYAEAYKDVIHEDAIRIGSAIKAPDYCFRIGGTRKFFIEAKKPSIDIKGDPHPAFQLRRYAWSAKLGLSILTDFEEFAVYDCRIRPKKTDRASTARIKYINYTEYPDRWDEIESIFSRDAILKGSFDKYAQSTKRKKGTAEVDSAFLAEIEHWREILARNLALRNPDLTNRQLNFAVQKTIDRIIFLRIAEDRGLERYGELLALCNGGDVYARLLGLFRKADDRYNSGLFHFQREKARPEGPDELTPALTVDDAVLKEIFKTLYYPDSPYEFSVLPAEILGHVYEQFLGKVITLTSAHRAKIEEKPEVKKAGGVYYTPAYIVDYIVENTVGKLLDSRTLKHFKTKPPRMDPPLTICDPACGSGSFLLGAYQYLLDWHLKHYTENNPDRWLKSTTPPITVRARHAVPLPSTASTPVIPAKAGIQNQIAPPKAGQQQNTKSSIVNIQSYKLTVTERKRILLDHIHGVDIDPQAVEVTKLSLLLKVLEGEKSQTLFATERALPDLANNIKCGNSLITPDFYQNQQMLMFDEEQTLKINAFEWKTEFPQIFNTNNFGFDTIIGNPPYGASLDAQQLEYFRATYECSAGSSDSYALFMEKSVYLLNVSGHFGMIVQSGWVSAPQMRVLRSVFSNSFRPLAFVSLPYDVFAAYVDTLIVIAEKLSPEQTLSDLSQAPVDLVVFPPKFKIASATDFESFKKSADAAKWAKAGHEEFLIVLSDTEASLITKLQATATVFSDVADIQRGVTPFHQTCTPPDMNSARAFSGTVRRYKVSDSEPLYIRYDNTLAEYKPPRYFHGPRLLLRELISRQFQLQATYVSEDFVTNKSMQSLLLKDPHYSILYLLGILNSRLLSWYFLSIHSVGRRDDFPKIVLRQARNLPVPQLDLSSPTDKSRHDTMVALVQTMLELNKALQTAKTPDEKTALQRQITATDNQIDQLVYKLYNLTEDEIKIVEESTK